MWLRVHGRRFPPLKTMSSVTSGIPPCSSNTHVARRLCANAHEQAVRRERREKCGAASNGDLRFVKGFSLTT